MGIIKQGILGGFSGKVANVVGSSWKGVAVIKSMPLSVANPKTAKQQGVRKRFASCVELLLPILSDVIKPLNDRFAGQMSGFNYALQGTSKAFNKDGTIADWSKVSISRGVYSSPVPVVSPVTALADKIVVSWDGKLINSMALADDVPYLAIYSEHYEKWFVGNAERRDDGDCRVALGDDVAYEGDTLHVYLAFLREDGTVVFEQQYASTFVPET